MQLLLQEFQDALQLRYGKRLLDLEDTCNRCCQTFSMEHAMSCKKGGLVTRPHEAVKQELIAMAELVYGKSCVGDKPKIFFGRNTKLSAACSNALINRFWVSGTTCIFDVHITDFQASSYKKQLPTKKKRYLHACKTQQHDFMPLVYSAKGMPGRETRTVEKHLARLQPLPLEVH
ncbi:hypothetical protein ACHAXS_001199 [Conticribra weissflogii]